MDLMLALSDFLSQPFGAFGALCIMLAVTVMNSRLLRTRLGLSEVMTGHLFNGLNLVGGACLLINAIARSEVVWLVLEIYFVMIAVKGIVQPVLRARRDGARSSNEGAASDFQPA